ncbi:hypothetical protein GU926_10900 [Nibribacter ruber]|uniref:Uncharacterized protein n=1 Tax=Nibribacter ruber TaxID=2698458 RepID=A0A6P1NY09_9BACT|nr:hypothetical protein [Nibribacter ruber]QHL87910.1 hypothetical protein GU926_10900 [Nibribacter ruber]
MLFGICNPELLKSGFAIRLLQPNLMAMVRGLQISPRYFRITNPGERRQNLGCICSKGLMDTQKSFGENARNLHLAKSSPPDLGVAAAVKSWLL